MASFFFPPVLFFISLRFFFKFSYFKWNISNFPQTSVLFVLFAKSWFLDADFPSALADFWILGRTLWRSCDWALWFMTAALRLVVTGGPLMCLSAPSGPRRYRPFCCASTPRSGWSIRSRLFLLTVRLVVVSIQLHIQKRLYAACGSCSSSMLMPAVFSMCAACA